MTHEPDASPQPEHPSGTRRRDLLFGLGGAGLGAAVGAAATAAARPGQNLAPATPVEFGREQAVTAASFQPGIAEAETAHADYLGLDLLPESDAKRIQALLRILSDDAARLMAGRAPVADQEPELAELPARLSIYFGFGQGLVDRVNPEARPVWLAPLPAFGIDRLEDAWSGGDLLIFIGSDDPLALAHARRMLLKDARAFTSIRWAQRGFRNARQAVSQTQTQRNLFGQLDGTVNPAVGTPDADSVTLITSEQGPGWLAGGTSLVLRRIRMNLETWDEVDRPGREAAVGRKLASGAPLTGVNEHDEPDFTATTDLGFTVIHPLSHMRRARGAERILRRVFSYDETVTGASGAGAAVSDAGLLFGAFQANPLTQFVPIQQRLADGDLLNTWTEPIGSAVFAIPPAAEADSFVGAGLFTA